VSSNRSTAAHSAVEFVIATVILGLALIPMFGIFSHSREATFKSKISYMAIHVARERLEELRQIPIEQLPEIATGEWTKCQGYAFRHTMDTRNKVFGTDHGHPYGALEDDAYKYPDEYSRIWTKVELEPIERLSFHGAAPDVDPGNVQAHPDVLPSRLFRVTLSYYWQETGEDVEAARLRHFNEISTIIGSHNIR